MAINPGYVQSGEVRNPNGRPVGSPNKRSQELQQRLRDRGDIDPADFCSSIVSNANETTELRLQASNYLLPYLYNKRGTVTPPRYIDEPVDLPHPEPTTLNQCNQNVAHINGLTTQGRLDLDTSEKLITNQRVIASNLIAEDELKIKQLNSGVVTSDRRIIVSGGLPDLPVAPGEAPVMMPTINGHQLDGVVVERITGPEIGSGPQDPTAPIEDPQT